jgi:hypothetical protein
MKKVYTQIVIITVLLIGSINFSFAQQWMVGTTVDYTVKYLKVTPLLVDSNTSCYDLDQPDGYFAFPTCPDPGIDYGFVVTELTSSDTVEITPSGVMHLGDTVWCTELPLWVVIERKIYFHEADGYITLSFFAVGEVTMPDVEVPCLPADSLWMQTLPVCNPYFWMNYGCTTVSNPLAVENLTIKDLQISYPSQLNNYNLSIEFDANIKAISIYDMQGRIVANSQLNETINCSSFNNGSYVLSVELMDGNSLRKKFVLTK